MGVYDGYVDSYSDIGANYSSWLNDRSNIHWSRYVDASPDLVAAFKEDNKDTGISKWDWGYQHYQSKGKNEARPTPKVINTNGLSDSSGPDGRGGYTTIMVQQDSGGRPQSSVEAKTGFGFDHWENRGGKNESRILPGAKFAIDPQGNLYVAGSSFIGTPLQSKYQAVASNINKTNGGNYKQLMEGLGGQLTAVGLNDLKAYNQLNVLSGVYAKKVTPWDSRALGAQPPTGGFDSSYYQLNTQGGAQALKQWNSSQSSVNVGGTYLPDLDVTARYTKDTYLHWYYTTQGKAAGDRGNAAQDAALSSKYTESLTDADYQKYRDQVLGLSDRFDNIKDWAKAQDPAALEAWYASLPSDQKQEYNEGTLAVPTADTIPDRLKDVLKVTKNTTFLEAKLSTVLGEKEQEQQQVFRSLTTDSLRQSINKLQEVKKQEQQYDFYSGLPGLNEVMTVNETLANSLLGDTGIGGIFGWMGDTTETQENLEKSLFGATGIGSRSNAVYNWQKWFDDELVKRYESGAAVEDPLDSSTTYQFDAEFAKDYIDRYLKPRFDTSRSMTEFISYMDVKQNEQNIFQTQSALDSLRDIADLRAKAYLDNIKSTAPLNFNPTFYFDPKGNFTEDDPKLSRYSDQKSQVAADWELAKTKGATEKVPGTTWTWDQWAYYYGLDIKNKDQFAKLHYQVKGAAKGFDPAKDLITLKDAEDYIDKTILPEIANEKLNLGDIAFLNFITPEEYADKLLEGISPEAHKEEWDKLLETLGLSEKDVGLAEVKQYIVDAFRTGAARAIRESIKYLNEKKITPSQEKLGVDYIERPEDKKTVDDANATALYKIFQNAGYQGNEDEFYGSFMTDIDRGDMELVTQASKGFKTSSLFSDLSSSDPFASLNALENIFNESKSTSSTSSKKSSDTASYFKLFNEEEDDYKSKTGQNILGEFTSMFKGFT